MEGTEKVKILYLLEFERVYYKEFEEFEEFITKKVIRFKYIESENIVSPRSTYMVNRGDWFLYLASR